jgi:hypothetical protein
MVRFMEMFGRVLACGGIATADMAAGLALAKRNPNSSFSQTLFTGIGSSLRGKILGR